MKIGELAKRCGLSAHTLRYYEKQGLINASGRSESNYRIYNEQDLKTANFIKRSRDIGFSLEEVAVYLSIRADKPAHECQEAKNITNTKINQIEQQISELQTMLSALKRLSDACCGGSESTENCSILAALESGESLAESHHE